MSSMSKPVPFVPHAPEPLKTLRVVYNRIVGMVLLLYYLFHALQSPKNVTCRVKTRGALRANTVTILFTMILLLQ